MYFTHCRSPEEDRHFLSPLVDSTSDDIVLSEMSKTLWPVFAVSVFSSGFHEIFVLHHQLAEWMLLSGSISWCIAVICSTDGRFPKFAFADFSVVIPSFLTTLQPLTPAPSQQQLWSLKCHVCSNGCSCTKHMFMLPKCPAWSLR